MQVLDREEFSMVVSMIEYDSFLGRICTGRIASGTVKVGGGGGPCTRPVHPLSCGRAQSACA